MERTAFLRAEPQLCVTDFARALEFFTRRLGFQVEFSYGEPAFYAQVARDAAYLNLRLVEELPIDSALARQQSYLAASICVNSISDLFAEYQSSAVDFHRELHSEPWGAETFIVADPDGNLILFAG